MFNRKYLISGLLVLALLIVLFFYFTRTEHGDPVEWMKKHGTIANRHEDLNKFCLDCHGKKLNQNKDNFCNDCHRRNKIKLIK